MFFRFDESAILKRSERRIWEEKRTRILFEYQQFSDYGSSTALLMYELAWKMSRDTNDLVCENYMVQIDKYRVIRIHLYLAYEK